MTCWGYIACLALLPEVLLLLLLVFGLLGLRLWAGHRRRSQGSTRVLGIFHPYCEAGGGGERVLWIILQALQEAFPPAQLRVLVYTASGAPGAQLMERARAQFNLPPFRYPVEFVRLRLTRWLDASAWPRFTLLGQSLGSMVVAGEALLRSPVLPDLWLDSMGYAFTFPVARLGFGCRVLAYVHYPTISTDMLRLVRERRPAHNNQVAMSAAASRLKLVYYWAFAGLYSLCGRLASLALVNSSWTRGHILQLWGSNAPVQTLFPPCDTRDLQRLPLEPRAEPPLVLSVAQFRPEKDHALQLRSFARFRREHPERARGVRLCLVGGARDQEDLCRVQELRQLARDLGLSGGGHGDAQADQSDRSRAQEDGTSHGNGTSHHNGTSHGNGDGHDASNSSSGDGSSDHDRRVTQGHSGGGDSETIRNPEHGDRHFSSAHNGGGGEDCVSFVVNAPFPELRALLGRAQVGLHTMWNEHFGIGVVEFMAAGAIPLAHDSGGPRADIVAPGCGFLASTEQAYAAALAEIFAPGFLGTPGMRRMRERARAHAQAFSQEGFAERFLQLVTPLIRSG